MLQDFQNIGVNEVQSEIEISYMRFQILGLIFGHEV